MSQAGSIPANLAGDGSIATGMGSGIGGQPSPAQMSFGYIDPSDRTDNAYHRNTLTVDKYSFVNDAYYADGGFFSGYYLVPFTTETMYRERRELATYKNFLRPITDAMVNPVFSDPIMRVCKTPADITLEESLYQSFLEDCDNSGSRVDAVIKEAVLEAVLQGMSFIVMDNAVAMAQPETEQAARDARLFPYIYMVRQNELRDYDLDRFGNIETITFSDSEVTEKDEKGQDVKVKRFRKWDKNKSQLLKEQTVQGQIILVPAELPAVHGLGVVPVCPVRWGKKKRGKLEIDSTMYEIAKLCWAIYNLDSERREVERHQGFSFFCVQGQPSTNTSVGAGNVLWIDPEAKNMPMFASPDADIIRVLREETDDMRQSLFEIAEQSGVTAVKKSGSGVKEASGISKEWDFRAHEFILQAVTAMARKTEEWVLSTFNLYTKQEICCEAKYPESFAPNSSAEDVKNYDALLMMDVSPTANRFIKAQAFKATFPNVPEDIMATIQDEIDTVPDKTVVSSSVVDLDADPAKALPGAQPIPGAAPAESAVMANG